jgi:hypothetical protein
VEQHNISARQVGKKYLVKGNSISDATGLNQGIEMVLALKANSPERDGGAYFFSSRTGQFLMQPTP